MRRKAPHKERDSLLPHHAAHAARAAPSRCPCCPCCPITLPSSHPLACLARPFRLQGPWVQQLMQMVPALGSGGSTSGMTPDHSHVRSSFD